MTNFLSNSECTSTALSGRIIITCHLTVKQLHAQKLLISSVPRQELFISRTSCVINARHTRRSSSQTLLNNTNYTTLQAWWQSVLFWNASYRRRYIKIMLLPRVSLCKTDISGFSLLSNLVKIRSIYLNQGRSTIVTIIILDNAYCHCSYCVQSSIILKTDT